MPLKEFLYKIHNDKKIAPAVTHHEKLPSIPARYQEPQLPLHDQIRDALNTQNINHLYSHQANAIDLIRSGHNVVAVTPTASGKSLIYNLAVISQFLEKEPGHALYLFPLKALEQDQATKLGTFLNAIGVNQEITIGVYDGDTPAHKRAQMRRDPPSILITNPDMIHLGMMPYNSSWEALFKGLRFIVLDELHIYRGVFGSHILHVLHRLVRLCNHYGSSPRFIATSATIAGAKELAESLTGHPFEVIDESGAPISDRHFIFFNPVESYLSFSLKLFIAALSSGLKTILFTKARRTTELLHRWLNETHKGLADKVSSYRAGFLPEERRKIERQLLEGKLDGVISTSALELGVDIGGLDVCVLVGYPGTIATTWQRAGRVGRGSRSSAVCIVAGQDQLDQYFARYPADFFARSVEKAIVDSTNEFIAKPHLQCAAQELPISMDDAIFQVPGNREMIEKLTATGKLLLSAEGDQWFSSLKRPQRLVDIRGAGSQFSIQIEGSDRILGSISGRAAFAECHPGAIYLHRAEQYAVTDLDILAKRVFVTQTRVSYYTSPMFEKETEILETMNTRDLLTGKVSLVRLKVTEQLVGYQKRRIHTLELMSHHDLDFPPTSYETVGVVVEIPREIERFSTDEGQHFRGGIHGVEHALLAMTPLFALCDRNDMGGYSQVKHPQVAGPSVFLYDGHPGGIGLSARLFDVFPMLVERTTKLIADCPCEIGCPSCIHSPKCGHGNIPLDKQSALLTLEVLAGQRKIDPPKPSSKVPINDYRKTEVKMKTESRPPTKKKDKKVKLPDRWQKDKTAAIFDLETQKSAQEVGGWGNIRKMKLAWGVVYRIPESEFYDFNEDQVDKLIDHLKEVDLVVGFNQIRFDYEVLRGYSNFDFDRLPSYDILKVVQKTLGHRLSLNALASGTLGAVKTADGLQSLEWWRSGEIDKIARYCRMDVELTRDLFYHILEKEFLLFEKKGIGLVRVPINGDPFADI